MKIIYPLTALYLLLVSLVAIMLFQRETVEVVESVDHSLVCQRQNYASKIHCLTNDHRESIVKPLLKYSAEAESIAKKRADHLCKTNTFSHNNWESFVDIEYVKAGENLTRNFDDSSKAFDALLDSPTHKENIESDWTHLGVYTNACSGSNITVQIFIQV